MLMCFGLNVAFIEAPPSTNLQQDTQYPHGITKSIIGGFSLIQGVNILAYATWWNNNNGLRVSSCTNLEIIGPKVMSP
jgi:hypothetical protein